MNRPQITDGKTDKLVERFYGEDCSNLLLIAIRGYFLNTFGQDGANNFNVWDDAMLVYENNTLIEAFNANTDPSRVNADKAMLTPGIYTFYKGVHNRRVKGFRAFPEGVRWDCKRQSNSGKWYSSTCGYINIHDPVGNTTGSEGCITLPNPKNDPQFNEFRDLVYRKMDDRKMKTVKLLLLEETEIRRVSS